MPAMEKKKRNFMTISIHTRLGEKSIRESVVARRVDTDSRGRRVRRILETEPRKEGNVMPDSAYPMSMAVTFILWLLDFTLPF